MISRQVKFSGITVLCAIIAISSLGCRNGGRGIDFTPKFALPKLRLPSFPCRLRLPNKHAQQQAQQVTCGCAECQRLAEFPEGNSYTNSQFEVPAASTPYEVPASGSGTVDVAPITSVPVVPSNSPVSEPLNEYQAPEPQEQSSPLYPTPIENFDNKLQELNDKELFIVPEETQSKPETTDNSFQVRGSAPSLKKTVTAPVQKALTSTDFKTEWQSEFEDFQPVELAKKAEDFKAELGGMAKTELSTKSAELADKLDPLTIKQPEPAMNPVEKVAEAVQAVPAPAPAPKLSADPVPVAPPVPVPAAPAPAVPVPAPPVPVAAPPAPPAPVAAAEPTMPQRIEVQAVEEIYGAILFDKRIQENLQAERKLSAEAPALPAELEFPEEPWKIELLAPQPKQVIQIKQPNQPTFQKNPTTEPIVLKAFSTEAVAKSWARPSSAPTVRQASSQRSIATAPVAEPASAHVTDPIVDSASEPNAEPANAEGNMDFIIQSLPTPPVEQAPNDYEFRSVPNYQIPVLRAVSPAKDGQSSFKIRVESNCQRDADSGEFCEATGKGISPVNGPVEMNGQPTNEEMIFIEREANNQPATFSTLR